MACDEGALRNLQIAGSIEADRREFMENLVESEFQRIRRLAWRFGVAGDDLDDAVQDVFALAWVGLKSFRHDSSASTWLTRIAINHFASKRRSKRREVQRLQESAVPKDMEGRVRGPGDAAAAVETREQVARCVERLPVRLKQAFVLRYLEEMSVSETAQILQVPEGTVRSRVYHARRQLRRMMRGFEQ